MPVSILSVIDSPTDFDSSFTESPTDFTVFSTSGDLPVIPSIKPFINAFPAFIAASIASLMNC